MRTGTHNVHRIVTGQEIRFLSALLLITSLLAILAVVSGCASINTFPKVARAGDTISLMLSNSEKARKDTVAVSLTGVNGTWDLQSLGKVRSVFNMRPEGRATGLTYSPRLDAIISWTEGHEPLQTVLVADLPTDIAPGPATLTVSPNVDDDASGGTDPLSISLEIVAGTGSSDDFLRESITGPAAVDFSRLEPAPHAKISFGNTGAEVIGAASVVVDFDETVLDPRDINVYVPEAVVRASGIGKQPFGTTQRMVYWHQDGQKLYIDVVAPQGLSAQFLKLFVLHPNNLAGNPNLALFSTTTYDLDGVPNSVPAALEYFP
jgi:hypothetical protein